MTTDWKTLREELPADVRQRLDAKRQQLRLGQALAEVRKALSFTQQDVASSASMTQNTISKIENADDMLLSSVIRYMNAMGGGLEILLKMPDGRSRRVEFDAALPENS